MAVSQVRKSLWTPDGPRDLQEKDVIPVMDPMERVTLVRMHEIAFNYGLSIVCKRCDHAIVGQNNDSSQVFAVACRCREFRFVR